MALIVVKNAIPCPELAAMDACGQYEAMGSPGLSNTQCISLLQFHAMI